MLSLLQSRDRVLFPPSYMSTCPRRHGTSSRRQASPTASALFQLRGPLIRAAIELSPAASAASPPQASHRPRLRHGRSDSSCRSTCSASPVRVSPLYHLASIGLEAELTLGQIADFSHLASIFILLHKMVQLNVRTTLHPPPAACASELLTAGPELLRHLLQVASSLSLRLRNSLSW